MKEVLEDPLSEALNVDFEDDESSNVTLINDNQQLVLVKTPITEDQQIEDYNLIRSTLHGLIFEGARGVRTLSSLSQITNSDKAYSALAKLIQSVNETTTKLKELHVKQEQKDDQKNIEIDKAVFVGSAADLLDHIKK